MLAPSARAQAPENDTFFDSKGVSIRYVDVGRGEPVVLIHGFSSSLDANWGQTKVIDALSKDFRVVAFDVRGHGKSDKPHDPASYGLAVVEDVTRLMDHLHIPRAHIVGYSMGGAITGKFITLHADRVISAVFGGSAPRLGWPPQAERDANELAESLEQGHGMRPLIVRLLPPNEPRPSDEAIERQSQASLGRNDALALAAVQRGNKEQAVTLPEVRALRMPLLRRHRQRRSDQGWRRRVQDDQAGSHRGRHRGRDAQRRPRRAGAAGVLRGRARFPRRASGDIGDPARRRAEALRHIRIRPSRRAASGSDGEHDFAGHLARRHQLQRVGGALERERRGDVRLELAVRVPARRAAPSPPRNAPARGAPSRPRRRRRSSSP